MQTQAAAEAADALGESWSSTEAGREREEGERGRSPSHRDAAKAPCGAPASLLCPEGPERFWTVQQQDRGGVGGLKNSYLSPSDS